MLQPSAPPRHADEGFNCRCYVLQVQVHSFRASSFPNTEFFASRILETRKAPASAKSESVPRHTIAGSNSGS